MRMICDSHSASWSFQSTRVPALCSILSLSYSPGDIRSPALHHLPLYTMLYTILGDGKQAT